MVVQCRKHASFRRLTESADLCECGWKSTGMLQVERPKVNSMRRTQHSVLMLDRGATLRQGHSGASGQGDVTWSLHPHRQSK